MNPDESSYIQSIHWVHHFKEVYYEEKINTNTLKMDNNHIRLLHCHHLHWHEIEILSYFDFDNMKFVEDNIKGLADPLIRKIKIKMKKVKVA